jgi:hypothetical protein
MAKLLATGAFALLAVFIISTAITVIAPYLAMLIVGSVIYWLVVGRVPDEPGKPPEE